MGFVGGCESLEGPGLGLPSTSFVQVCGQKMTSQPHAFCMCGKHLTQVSTYPTGALCFGDRVDGCVVDSLWKWSELVTRLGNEPSEKNLFIVTRLRTKLYFMCRQQRIFAWLQKRYLTSQPLVQGLGWGWGITLCQAQNLT